MPSSSSRTVEFSAKVPSDLYDEFKLLFPQYGAVTWFINAALVEFIQQVRDNGTVQQRVHDAIATTLEERKDGG